MILKFGTAKYLHSWSFVEKNFRLRAFVRKTAVFLTALTKPLRSSDRYISDTEDPWNKANNRVFLLSGKLTFVNLLKPGYLSVIIRALEFWLKKAVVKFQLLSRALRELSQEGEDPRNTGRLVESEPKAKTERI